ncbi:hypothetical protein DFH06DRAFT_1198448 [Mycena polygramma]|nr:hypothetical protein DFH06DRAFT_1198448 [Mycena polygramma]
MLVPGCLLLLPRVASLPLASARRRLRMRPRFRDMNGLVAKCLCTQWLLIPSPALAVRTYIFALPVQIDRPG